MIDKKRGLSSKEAQARLEQFGLNEIKDVGKNTPVKIFLRQIKNNFIVYLLIFATIISFFVGKHLTAYVILGVIFIVVLTGFIQEYRAEKAILALKNMIMPISIVIRDGVEQEIPSNKLVVGDIIILRNGEKIPADCVVLEQKDLLVDESVLTGESKEVKKVAVSNIKNYKEENLIFMGSFIVNGKCVAQVIHVGMNTRFGKIANLISTSEKELPLQKKVAYISKYMALFGIFFAVLTGIIFILRSQVIDSNLLIEALIMVIAMCVAAFPEGFPVVLITSLATGSYRMAKKNAIINRMSIIETLGETTVICADKTGTITKGEMTVKKIFCDNKEFDVLGSGYEAHGEILHKNRKTKIEKEETLSLLLKAGLICNDSKISRIGTDKAYKITGMPTEGALLILGAKANMFKEDYKINIIDEIPFSSERKMMTVLSRENDENIVYCKGALEILLSRCKYIKRYNGIFRLLEKEKKKILEYNHNLTSNCFRTLGLAYKKVKSVKENLETDLVFIGMVAMEDPPREEVKEALITCKQAGIKVKMITGDNKQTAISIARQINLDKGKILEGNELDKITDEELCKIVKDIVIFARVRPEHKLRIVKALKENGEIVTMTGDGVNDSPALKEAHIGVAMGKNGTDVSRSVADMTLKDDNFSTIVDAIKEGRTIFMNIQKFSTYQISVNFSQVMIIFLAIALGMPLPLIPIQILFMNLFSDEITAITLAFNPYSKDVMTTKPRRKSNIITKPLFLMLIISGIIMSIGSLAVFYYALSIGKSIEGARTACFITMVFFGITNAYNFRSFRKLSINRSIFTNKPLFYASVFAIVMTFLIVYSPLHFILETTKIRLGFWVIAIITSLSVVLLFDLLKYLNEKNNFWQDDLQSFK